MRLTMKGLFVTASINDTQHNKTIIMLSAICCVLCFIYCYAECRYAKYSECRCTLHSGRLRPNLQMLNKDKTLAKEKHPILLIRIISDEEKRLIVILHFLAER